MEVEINMVQFVGIWLMISGLFLHSGIFLFAYYKIVAGLNNDDNEKESEEGEEEEKKSFPIIRFVFHFRKIVSTLLSPEKREEYKKIITVIDWIIMIALAIIILGFLLVLIGSLF